eukprot:4869426-Amphidinium_carterae.1
MRHCLSTCKCPKSGKGDAFFVLSSSAGHQLACKVKQVGHRDVYILHEPEFDYGSEDVSACSTCQAATASQPRPGSCKGARSNRARSALIIR